MQKRDEKGRFVKGRFVKGHTPWNKEKKGYINNGSFKKGHIPWNKNLKGLHLSPKTEFTSERLKQLWRMSDYRKKMKSRQTWNKNLKGLHLSPETEFTSDRSKELWRTPDYRQKMKSRPHPRGMLGKEPWNKGLTKENSEGVRLISEANKGKNNPMYGKRPSKETWRKLQKAWHLRPNRPERFLIDLFERNNLPLKYVGDGELIIDGRCPDFSDGNGNLAEFFGKHWHEPEEEQERIEFFKKRGYACLVIWEHELKDEGNLVSEVTEFLAG